MNSRGGQGAQAFSQGLMRGYAAVDNAITNQQTRELRAQEASQKAELHKQQIASNNKTLEAQGYKNAGLQQLDENLKATNDKISKAEGALVSGGFNSIVGAADPQSALDTFKARYSNNPALGKLGVKNLNTARIPNSTDTNDLNKITSSLLAEGADFTGYSEEQVKEVSGLVADSGLYVEVDGAMVNLDSLNVVTGGTPKMDPKEKKIYDEKKTKLEDDFKAIQDDVDKNAYLTEDAKKQELKKLADQQQEQAAQLAGTAQLPDNKKNPTIASLLGDYLDENPDASDEELLKYSRSLRGKIDADDYSVYEKKVMDLKNTINPETGKNYTDSEAVRGAIGGASSIGRSDDVAAYKGAKTAGHSITLGSGTPNLKLGTSQGSMDAEAKFATTKSYDKSKVRKFSENTQATKMGVAGANRVLKGIEDGTLDYSVIETGIQKIKEIAPQELTGYIEQFMGGKLDDEQFREKIGVKGEMGLVIANLTKSYFGGNASNRDAKTFIDLFGFDTWSNEATIKSRLTSLKDITLKQYNQRGESMINDGYTYTTSTQMTEVQGVNKKTKGNLPNTNANPITRTVNGVTKTWDGKKWV